MCVSMCVCVCLVRASWLWCSVWELWSVGSERHADKDWILLKCYLHVFPSSQPFFTSRTPKSFPFSFWMVCIWYNNAEMWSIFALFCVKVKVDSSLQFCTLLILNMFFPPGRVRVMWRWLDASAQAQENVLWRITVSQNEGSPSFQVPKGERRRRRSTRTRTKVC